MRCLLDDRESLTVYLRFPREHWNRVRAGVLAGQPADHLDPGLRLLQDLRRTMHDPPTQLPQRNSVNHAETGVAPLDSVAIA